MAITSLLGIPADTSVSPRKTVDHPWRSHGSRILLILRVVTNNFEKNDYLTFIDLRPKLTYRRPEFTAYRAES
jgi:hypothetical protein